MKKKVIQTTFLLLVISCISKVLSFLNRIFIARTFSDEALHYYSLATPFLVFLISLAHFGIPSALTQLVASKKEARDSICASILLSVLNNLLLCLATVLIIPLYARLVLKQNILIPVLYSCIPVLPCVMISGLLKGYFTGMQNMVLSSSSQITEEVFRLGFLFLFLPYASFNPIILACLAFFSQCIGEIGSCLHLGIALIFKRGSRLKYYLFPKAHKQALIELLSLSVPMTAARMIGSLTAFCEPIILLRCTSVALKEACTNVFTQINTTILPLITLPAFFSIAISSWILPAFSKAYTSNLHKAKKIFTAGVTFSLVLGLSSSMILYLFAEPVCSLLYHSTDMADLLKLLALPFSIYALQPVLISVLHGAKSSKQALFNTTCGCLVRLVLLYIFCICQFEKASAYALMVSSFFTTLLHLVSCLQLFVHNRKSI